MARITRDFFSRSADEQQDFLTQTWCNKCQEADLGMTDPVEYEEGEKVLIEGKCSRCGEVVTTELIE
jgi:formylmethanofuran dehydrogenase subunit E